MGFNCKNNYFPISILSKMLLHNESRETIKECQHYGLTVVGDKVELSKSSFNYEVDEVTQIRIILNWLFQFLWEITFFIFHKIEAFLNLTIYSSYS